MAPSPHLVLLAGSRSCRAQSYSLPIRTFLYLHCTDLELARRFYSDLLGLTEIYFSEEEGSIGYLVGTLQISISTHAASTPVDGWAKQMGWEGGFTATPSWGIEMAPHEFRRSVQVARDTGIDVRNPEPRWVGY